MQDITDLFRARIPPFLRMVLEAKSDIWGEQTCMTSRIVSCNSLAELAAHYEEIKPCYAFVSLLRVRHPEIAYADIKELRGCPVTKDSHAKREFILQDRFSKEWCWAEDVGTPWFRPKIKQQFADYEILEAIFGKVHFGATFSGPVRHIDVLGYRVRIPGKGKLRTNVIDTMPAYASAMY